MLDGRTLQAWSTEMFELAQANASYSSDSNHRTRASKCENTSENDVVFEQYHSYNLVTTMCNVNHIVIPSSPPCYNIVHCTQACFGLLTILSQAVQPCLYYMGSCKVVVSQNSYCEVRTYPIHM